MARPGQLCRPPAAARLEQLATLAYDGWRQQRMAEQLGVSRRTVVRWLARSDVQAIIDELIGLPTA
jgi:DNA-binding transcriptional regulator LsrR (DeoR family)